MVINWRTRTLNRLLVLLLSLFILLGLLWAVMGLVAAAPLHQVSAPNPVGHWAFDEGAGSTTADAGGLYTGTMILTPIWVTDTLHLNAINPYALQFDGSSNYVQVDNSSGQFDLSQMSLLAWIKPDWTSGTASYNPGLIGIRGGGGTRISLHIRDDYSGLDSYNGSPAQFYAYPFQQGQWYHIAMTWDGVNESLFVNGSLVASNTLSVNTSVTLQPLVIGASRPAHEYFPGHIDDTRIYDQALTATQIQGLMGLKPPMAVADTYITTEDIPLTIAAPGLLNNDFDPNNDPLTATLATPPGNGTAVVNAAGGFTYTPTLNYNGPDSFSYLVQDGPAPALGSWPFDDGSNPTSDVSGNAYHGTLHGGVTFTTTVPMTLSNSSLALTFDGNDDYVDLPDMPDSFANGLTIAAWVYYDSFGDWSRIIDFGNGPNVDNIVLANEGTSHNLVFSIHKDGGSNGVVAPNALRPNTWMHIAATLDANGTATLYKNGNPIATNTVDIPNTVTRANNYIGRSNWANNAYFDGQMDDLRFANYAMSHSQIQAMMAGSPSDLSDTALVTITVAAVNDPPVIVDDIRGPLTNRSILIDVLANDMEVDGESLTLTQVGPPLSGTVMISANQVFYTPPSSTTVFFTDSFTYTASDGTLSDTGVVTITVAAVNNPPVAVADTYATTEDLPLTIAAPGLLNNDLDPDNDPLTTTLAAAPGKGTVMVNADGGFTYIPTLNLNGIDKFTYRVQDGLAPALGSWPFDDGLDPTTDLSGNAYHGALQGGIAFTTTVPMTLSNSSLALTFDGNDDYVDLPDMPDSFANGLTIAGWVYYDGFGNWSRIVDFGNGANVDNIVLANEGTSSNLVFSIHKDGGSSRVVAPNALGLNTWMHIAATLDANGMAILYKNGSPIVTGTAGIPNTVTRTNNYIGRSNWPDAYFDGRMDDLRFANYAMSHSQIQAVMAGSPSGLADTALVTITVAAVNDPPVIVDDTKNILANMTTLIDVLANDREVDGESLTLTRVGTPLNGGTTVISGQQVFYTSPSSSTILFTDSFTYTVSDGISNNTGVVTLTRAIVVTTTNTTLSVDGFCSLPEAIINANDSSSGNVHADCPPGDPTGVDIIWLSKNVYTLTVPYTVNVGHPTYPYDADGYGPNGLPPVSTTITIYGNGATIKRNNSAPNFRLFYITASGNLTLQDLTLRDGLARGGDGGPSDGGGQGGGSAGMGGAIFNKGQLTLKRITLTANQAVGGNGGTHSDGFGNHGSGGGGMGGNGTGEGGAGGINGNGGEGGGGSGGSSAAIFDPSDNGAPGGFGGGGGGGGGAGSLSGGNGANGGAGGFGGGSGNDGFGGFDTRGGGGGGGAGMGGAIFNMAGTLIMTNSTLSGNSVQGGSGANADSGFGGAIFNWTGTLTTYNTTVADNLVYNGGATGGAIYNYLATLTLHNTILANSQGHSSNDCFNNDGTVTAPASYKNLIENHSGCGTPAITADPQLTALGDYGGLTWSHALHFSSPAIDAGNNATCAATDQRGLSRPQGSTCDIGAFEFDVANLKADLALHKGVTPTTAAPGQPITYTLTFSNTGSDTATGIVITDRIPISVTSPITFHSSLNITPTGNISYVWVVENLAPGEIGVITISGILDPLAQGIVTNTAEITTTSEGNNTTNNIAEIGVRVCPAPVLYVDKNVSSSGNGSSWPTAFTNLQEALITAKACSGVAEIWVATGIYTPGTTRNDTFQMVSGVAIYGGFATTETLRSQRDWQTNLTVLSGDIDSNDIDPDGDGVITHTDHITGNNSEHVVTADSNGISGTPITETTVLDGFIITAGQANGNGGGMYNNGANGTSSPSLSNITFFGNSAGNNGGAIYNNGFFGTSSPHLNNITFSNNRAGSQGGAMYNDGLEGISSPHLNNITFSNNRAGNNGGAIYNNGFFGTSSPHLNNVTFSSNRAGNQGGAIYNYGDYGTSSPNLSNVTFSGNSAANSGGGMYNYSINAVNNPSLNNVTFSGNAAGNQGGGMVNHSVFGSTNRPTLNNVIFSGNSAANNGGGMYNYSLYAVSDPSLNNVTFSGNVAGNQGGAMYNDSSSPIVYNSILWNNQDGTGIGTITATIVNSSSLISLTRSLVQGSGGSGLGWVGGSYQDGGNNLDSDPFFASIVSPTAAPTTTGDLRLLPGSPAIDSGLNSAITATADISGNNRIINGTVDMGAYESQGFTLAITGGDEQSSPINAAFANPLQVTVGSNAGEPVGPGGVISFTAPSSGASLNPAVFTATTDSGGAVSATVMANSEVGSYQVTVTTSGANGPVNFNLTNDTFYTLTTYTTGDGSGTVTPTNGVYTSGTVITLTAITDLGAYFTGWSGDLSGLTNPVSLTMDTHKAVTASFSIMPPTFYTLSLTVVGSGTVTSTGSSYLSGTVISLSATPDSGWQFDGWSGDLSSSTTPISLTMDADKVITAIFSQIITSTPEISYTLSLNVVGSGTVTPTSGSYLSGTVISLNATPDSGWQFAGWSGDLSSTTTPINLTMDADKVITATFSQIITTTPEISYTLSLNVVGSGTVTPTSGSYLSGTVISLSATPDSGWQFAGWSGDLSSTIMPINLTMNAHKVVTATFSQIITPTPEISYTLSLNVVGSGTVTPTSGSYLSGTVISLNATPDSGWQFAGWSGDLSSTITPINLTMDADKVITATFTMSGIAHKIYLPLLLK